MNIPFPLGSTGRGFVNVLVAPLFESSTATGETIKSTIGAFRDVRKLKSENNDLLLENARLRTESAEAMLILERYNTLLIAEDSFPKAHKYKWGDIVYDSSLTNSNTLTINIGKDDGVQKGDVVTVEGWFIGLIQYTNKRNSGVVLPTANNSSHEVIIIGRDRSDIQKVLKDSTSLASKNVVRGVVVGQNNSMVIQNVDNNADVDEGDYVFISDVKIGGIYYLGEVVEISSDPADSTRQVFIKTPYNYNELISVQVEIDE